MNSLHRLFTAKGAGLLTRISYLQMVGCPLDHVPARYMPESRTVYDYLYVRRSKKDEDGREADYPRLEL